LSPPKPRPPMVQVWVWFVGQTEWKRMSIRQSDLPLIGSPTALITVESDGFLASPMPGWRVTRVRPGNGGPPPLASTSMGRPGDG
jgi:hypothetical protein